jgi:septal ring factor EnvC (AmiA/AmiB activator)
MERIHRSRAVLPYTTAACILFIGAACAPSRAFAIQAIDHAISDVENAKKNDPAFAQVVEHLQQTIDDGKHTIADLRVQSDRLEDEKTALQKQKDLLELKNNELHDKQAGLERVQTALASGLVGAILTALVAIAGVILKTLGSRVERDLRQLEIVEKVAALRKAGVEPPADLVSRYGVEIRT